MPRSRKPKADPPDGPMTDDATLREVARILAGGGAASRKELEATLDAMIDEGLAVDDLAMIDDGLAAGDLAASDAESPLDQAQSLVWDAWETPSAKKRIALARNALELSPDCADAYSLLADEAEDVAEAHALTRDAVAAGERALGGSIEQLVEEGAMWLALESRPYLRALAQLAAIEWEIGDRQAAIARGWELLRRNPNDNQGMRYMQLVRLLHAGSVSEIERLLAMYDEGNASWAFGRTLHLFRTRGPGPEANAALRTAKQANRHVVAYLLADREMPEESPAYIGYGDESEAQAYALDAWTVWADAPGALPWLASMRGPSKAGPRRKRR